MKAWAKEMIKSQQNKNKNHKVKRNYNGIELKQEE